MNRTTRRIALAVTAALVSAAIVAAPEGGAVDVRGRLGERSGRRRRPAGEKARRARDRRAHAHGTLQGDPGRHADARRRRRHGQWQGRRARWSSARGLPLRLRDRDDGGGARPKADQHGRGTGRPAERCGCEAGRQPAGCGATRAGAEGGDARGAGAHARSLVHCSAARPRTRPPAAPRLRPRDSPNRQTALRRAPNLSDQADLALPPPASAGGASRTAASLSRRDDGASRRATAAADGTCDQLDAVMEPMPFKKLSGGLIGPMKDQAKVAGWSRARSTDRSSRSRLRSRTRPQRPSSEPTTALPVTTPTRARQSTSACVSSCVTSCLRSWSAAARCSG